VLKSTNWHIFAFTDDVAKVSVMEATKYITSLRGKWKDLKKDNNLLFHLCLLPISGNDPLLYYFFLNGFTYLKQRASKVKSTYSDKFKLFIHNLN
jgi:hypothetical protein